MQHGQIRHRTLTLYDDSRSRLTVFLRHTLIIARRLPSRSSGSEHASHQPRSRSVAALLGPLADHRRTLTAETMESPVLSNGHAGFGERPGETDRR